MDEHRITSKVYIDIDKMTTMERIKDIRSIRYPNQITVDILVTVKEHLDAITKALEAKDARIKELEWDKEMVIESELIEEIKLRDEEIAELEETNLNNVMNKDLQIDKLKGSIEYWSKLANERGKAFEEWREEIAELNKVIELMAVRITAMTNTSSYLPTTEKDETKYFTNQAREIIKAEKGKE